MKILVLFFIGGAVLVLLATGAFFFYCGVSRIFKNKPDDYFDKDAEY